MEFHPTSNLTVKSVSQSVDVANPVICTKYHNTLPPPILPLPCKPHRAGKLLNWYPNYSFSASQPFDWVVLLVSLDFHRQLTFFIRWKLSLPSPCQPSTRPTGRNLNQIFFYILGIISTSDLTSNNFFLIDKLVM